MLLSYADFQNSTLNDKKKCYKEEDKLAADCVAFAARRDNLGMCPVYLAVKAAFSAHADAIRIPNTYRKRLLKDLAGITASLSWEACYIEAELFSSM